MSIKGKSLMWMLGVAAGGAVALLATTQNTKKAKKSISKGGIGGRYNMKRFRNLYDDSYMYYI